MFWQTIWWCNQPCCWLTHNIWQQVEIKDTILTFSFANLSGASTTWSLLSLSEERPPSSVPFVPFDSPFAFFERLPRFPSVKEDPWAAGFRSKYNKTSKIKHLHCQRTCYEIPLFATCPHNMILSLHNYIINTTNLMHTSLSLTLHWRSMSRHVLGISCLSSGGTTGTQNWWLLCAVVDVGWSPETNPHLQLHTTVTNSVFVYCLLRTGKSQNMSRHWTSIMCKWEWSVHQVGCVYYVIMSLRCTVNKTSN
jgi:hypothetical protein